VVFLLFFMISVGSFLKIGHGYFSPTLLYNTFESSCINDPVGLRLVKVKRANLVRDRGGPKGCETSRLLRFLENWLKVGGEVVSLTRQLTALYRQGNS
jgi:hypothetical protein